MDELLAEAARKLHAENIFETVRRCYCDANKEYLRKQIEIVYEYLTEEQKQELEQCGLSPY